MKDRASQPLTASSLDPVPKSGMALLTSLVLMTVLSFLLLHWYQNEIQFRLQAESSLKYQSIHQELEGALGQSILLLQGYTKTQLRESPIVLPHSKFRPFFSEWSAQSKPAENTPFLPLELTYESPSGAIIFEALLRFEFYSLADIPWLNLSPENADPLPNNLIFANEQDRLQALAAPRFSLLPALSAKPFDQIFYGDVRMVWEEEKLTAFQGNDEWILTDISGDQLSIQIKGNASIAGDLTASVSKKVYFQIIGNLVLELPTKTAEFSQTSPNLFVRVSEKMVLQAQHSGNSAVQINGYFWIEKDCFTLQSSFSAIYWKGSLACQMKASLQWSVPLHLLHSPYPRPHPASFDRTTLQLSGVRPLSL